MKNEFWNDLSDETQACVVGALDRTTVRALHGNYVEAVVSNRRHTFTGTSEGNRDVKVWKVDAPELRHTRVGPTIGVIVRLNRTRVDDFVGQDLEPTGVLQVAELTGVEVGRRRVLVNMFR